MVEPGLWNFYDRGEDGRRVVGSVQLGGIPGFRPTLVLQSSGRDSMKRLRDAVKSVFGRSLTHINTRYEKPRWTRPGKGDLLETHEVTVDLEALGIDPEAPDAMQQAERALRQQFLDRWIDQPLPALDGATPREAAARPDTRPAVVRLLRDYEGGEVAWAEKAGLEPIDFERVWTALGLKVPLAASAGEPSYSARTPASHEHPTP